MAEHVLDIRNLTVDYETRGTRRRAVDGVSLHVEPGEVLGVVGESGSGKSTIAQSIIGLQAPNAHILSGSVRLRNTELLGASKKMWRQVRGTRIGLIPQDPNNSLNPLRTVGASIAEPMLLHSGQQQGSVRRRVLALLEMVGIPEPERRARQYPHELSGGMKQRVLIAAAVALEPEVVIADEPTSALDVTVQRRILDLIDDLRSRMDTAVVLITHDMGVARERADRLLVMHDGREEESGPTREVLAIPKRDYTRTLIANVPAMALRTRPKIDVDESVPPLVEVRGLTREFARGRRSVPFRAVDDVSFVVPRGTTHALVGESGSGKTTIGRLLAGFDRASAGSIRVADHDVGSLRNGERKRFRRAVQLVYQNPFGSLDPRQSVSSIVAEPLRNFGIGSGAEREAMVAEMLDAVALPEQYANRLPRELSGGQRQRVAIARALVAEPDLVVLDEAVSALDVTVQAQILRLLEKLQRERGLTYIFISHDLAVVRQISDSVTVLKEGIQVEAGDTETLFTDPQHPYTQALLEAVPGWTLLGDPSI
ncbi:MAG: ABC transporter ATP-binding protein [Propionibacterium sp.]|nr:ABC transporter ATP-binding protein [Propionibacterium sp.]